MVAGLAFFWFAYATLKGEDDEEEEKEMKHNWGPIFAIFGSFLAASRASGLPEHITSHSPSLHGLLEAIGHGMPVLVSLWVPPITMMTIISSSEL